MKEKEKEDLGRRVGDLLRNVPIKTIPIWHGKFRFWGGEKHVEVDLVKIPLSRVCSRRAGGQSGFEHRLIPTSNPCFHHFLCINPSSVRLMPLPALFGGKSLGISVKLGLVIPARRTLSRVGSSSDDQSQLRIWNSPLMALPSVQTTFAYVVVAL